MKSFKNLLNKVLLGGVVLAMGSVSALSSTKESLPVEEATKYPCICDMLHRIDFEKIISSTISIDQMTEQHSLYSVDAENAYGGSDLPIDWDKVCQFALDGNPVAQFIHGNRCLRLATRLYNGERIQKKFEAYMFLLISAIKGNFKDSEDCFTYMGDISGLKTKFGLTELVSLATKFSMRF